LVIALVCALVRRFRTQVLDLSAAGFGQSLTQNREVAAADLVGVFGGETLR
jgi:hypothetical protein